MPQPLEQEKVNILVVDDLPEKHVVLRSILDELGQNIVSARSGQEALRCILEMEFAVILLDVNMPDIDGLETAGLIRQYKKSAQTPIVFITAYVDELQARRGYALGAVDYIPSPVVPEVLRSKVRVFVELFRMNRQLQVQAAAREALARSEAARAAAEEAIQRADYLSQSSQRLSRSLNIDDTIAALFDVAVPVLADRAVLALTNADGTLGQMESHPPPPGGAAEPLAADACARPWSAPSTAARSNSGARATRRRRSARCWPAAMPAARWCCSDRDQRMDSSQLALAKEVVSRASIAMENARLYTAVQEADRRKNEFLAMLAHELRNPLAPIRNAVHIMQGSDVTQLTMNWARDVIGRQADHMARLIDDLLDVSRIVQGKVVVKPERLALAVVGGAIAGRQLAPHRRARPDAGGGTAARAHRAGWRRGAAGAGAVQPHQQRVEVLRSPHPDHVERQLCPGRGDDLGAGRGRGHRSGVPAAHLRPVRPGRPVAGPVAGRAGHRPDAGEAPGRAARRPRVGPQRRRGAGHRGQGRPAGPAGGGRERRGLHAPCAREPQSRTKAPGRILVVDDLAASAETLMTLLEMEGFEVRVASEGRAALEIAEQFRPDVVLLDIGLPGMNGFEVAHRLRAQPESRDALLIALTGYGEAESRSRSAQAGFDFHMVKPADVNLLLTMLANPQQARTTRAKAA